MSDAPHDFAILCNDSEWETRADGKLLLHVGQHLLDSPPTALIRDICRRRGAWAALWSYDWDRAPTQDWYTYICDNPKYDIDQLDGKSARKHVRRALADCEVRRVDSFWLADNAYELSQRAAERYSKFALQARDRYVAGFRKLASTVGFEGWGVFHANQLIGMGTFYLKGRFVQFSTAQFDPHHADKLPMYALYMVTGKHYLRERGLSEIVGGTRELSHETNIGEFRLKMGWRRANCRLGVFLAPWLGIALLTARLTRPMARRIIPPHLFTHIEALLLAQDIARRTRLGASRTAAEADPSATSLSPTSQSQT